jgi:hypothetical protein
VERRVDAGGDRRPDDDRVRGSDLRPPGGRAAEQRVYRGYWSGSDKENDAILPKEAEKLLRSIVGRKVPRWEPPTSAAEKVLKACPADDLAVAGDHRVQRHSIGSSEDVMADSIVNAIKPTRSRKAASSKSVRSLKKQGWSTARTAAPQITKKGVQVAQAAGAVVTAQPSTKEEGADEAPSDPAGYTATGRSSRRAHVQRLIGERPGITIPELADALQIHQNYLYRILPGMAEDGEIVKRGRGWFPSTGQQTEARAKRAAPRRPRARR